MKLSRTERWILANQYRILEILHPEEAEHYKNAREVLERGYELEYGWVAEDIYAEGLAEEDCSDVVDALQMFQNLQRAYDALDDKSGIEPHLLSFPGFCGNSETAQMAYCRHYCGGGDDKRYEDLRRSRDFNSHIPMRGMYRRMMAVWKPLFERGLEGELSREDILTILAARPHPDSPQGKLARAEPLGPVQ